MTKRKKTTRGKLTRVVQFRLSPLTDARLIGLMKRHELTASEVIRRLIEESFGKEKESGK